MLILVSLCLAILPSSFLQVFPLWYCVSGGWKDLRDGRPFGHGEEVGLLCHHCGNGLGAARTVHPPGHVLLHHQEKPHSLHKRHSTSPSHLLGHFLQVKHMTLQIYRS